MDHLCFFGLEHYFVWNLWKSLRRKSIYLFSVLRFTMKNIKKFCSVLCIIILFIGYGKFFHYILVDDTSSYTRLTMHELYHAKPNIDVLFVGSSHVYRSLNPKITDSIFGLNTFNAGTSSQGMDGSLAVIKEAAAYHSASGRSAHADSRAPPGSRRLPTLPLSPTHSLWPCRMHGERLPCPPDPPPQNLRCHPA